jgi:uncharacterized protein YndB with AHSA1/START domain
MISSSKKKAYTGHSGENRAAIKTRIQGGIMSEHQKEKITINTTVHVPVDKAWIFYTEPEHITKWNHASDDWHSPSAENDLRTGGKFSIRMEAKDGSAGFDFGGVYDEVKEHESIKYTMGDGRKVIVHFENKGNHTHITIVFDAETENSLEMQRQGWQAILDNYRKYAEKHN